MAKKNCSSTNLYESLEHCKGKPVVPGLRPEIWGIPKTQITGWPTLPDIDSENADMKKIATYEGDFALAADNVFFKIDILTMASKLSSASQGEYPNKTYLNTLTVKYAGVDEDATGFCRMANSDDLVYVVRQRNGKFRVLGNDAFETDTKPSQDSGMAVTDASGTTLEITATDFCPAPFYTGKLVTAEGTIDCSTGEITVTGSGS